MPKARQQGESEKDFISRCMSEIKSEFPDQSQRYAVCKSYSDKSESKMKQEELFVLTPKKSENRGMYLKRCSAHSKIKSQFMNLKERSAFCLSSFNEYYKWWNRIEMAEVPENTVLGDCIAENKARGLTYHEAYARCATKVGTPPLGAGGAINLNQDNLLVEPVMTFGEDISIDFDDTLSTPKGMEMAKKLIADGNTLHIVTRRNSKDSGEVYKAAEELGIPKNMVHFTNGELKWKTIKEIGAKEHIDNNQNELDAIKENLPDVKTKKFSAAYDKCIENNIKAGFPKESSVMFCKSRMEKNMM